MTDAWASTRTFRASTGVKVSMGFPRRAEKILAFAQKLAAHNRTMTNLSRNYQGADLHRANHRIRQLRAELA